MSSGEPPIPEIVQIISVRAEEPSKKRSKRQRIVLPFTIDPGDVPRVEVSWIERLRRYAKTGGVGLVASVIAHAVILVILGFVVLRVQRSANFDTRVVTWGPPGSLIEAPPKDAAERAKGRRPVNIPIDVDSTAGTPEVAKATKTTPGAGQLDGHGSVGVRLGDVSGALGDRNPRTRAANLEQLGGTPDTEKAIRQGLAWLVRQQTKDGHWELHQGYPDAGRSYIKTDTGATALALLALLGHGHTHQIGEHHEVVAKGLKWLQGIQDRSTGDLHDQRQEEGRNPAFYAHSMATIVLCEALALSRDDQLRPSAEHAVKYLINSQHPDMGGWKYRPLTQRVMAGDISVTAWALMALHSARIAGIAIAPEEFERSSSFLDKVQELGGARYKYEPNEPSSRVTPARTAIGLLCRQWLGWPKNYPPMMDGVKYLMDDRNRPEWSAGRRNVFEWYYITQVMHNIGGDDWKLWNSAVFEAVVRNQVTGGSGKAGTDTRGSWNPKPEGEGEEYADKAGRLYITAMCVLILETPYRHRPIYGE